MKTIEFVTTADHIVNFVPDKIAAILAKSLDVTQFYVIGEWSLFEVKGSYNQTMRKIREV